MLRLGGFFRGTSGDGLSPCKYCYTLRMTDALTTEIGNPIVAQKFSDYPDSIREKLLFLRRLILEAAAELDGIGEVEETLKWGEPSYVTKTGSTIRIDWKRTDSGKYAMYFNCRTSLVETFKELYPARFRFEGNRAIVFDENDAVPVGELKHCVSMSLNYHRIKHLPMLGA